MAIIRTGPVVAAISGGIGGVVFVAGSRSAVVRPRPIAHRKSSPALATARARFMTVRNAWKQLTVEQKAAWATAAALRPSTNRLGQASPMSAFLLFVRTNVPRLYSFELIAELPAIGGVGPTIKNVVPNFSEAGEYRVTGDAIEPPIVATYIYYGWPFWTDRPTKSVPRLAFLRATITIGASADLRNDWIARFGPLREGQQFAVGIIGRLPATDFPVKTIARGEVNA